jgi:prepilin-type N-terminal cleavage/methylation domain-containing protein
MEDKEMRKSGFTLIELLIVLAILGILVGIVAMSVGNLTETALKRGLQSEYNVVQTAMDAYNTQNVAVDGEAAIAAQATAAQILAAGTTFEQYLKRDTKYYYTYIAGGDTLVVQDKATSPSLSWDGAAFTP